MIRLNFILTAIFICLFLSLISCGQNSVTQSIQNTPSPEFLQFVKQSQEKSYQEFANWWNTSESKKWKWANYAGSGYPESSEQVILQWPDSSTPEEIYQSKLINCYRATILFQKIYGGEAVYLKQEGKNWSHEVLLLENNGKYSYLSLSGLKLTHKELFAVSREEAIRELNSIFKKF